MKKLTLGLAVLLSSVSTSSLGLNYQGYGPFTLGVPNLCGGFNIGLTALWVRSSTHHLDYALRYPSIIPLSPEDPFGPLDIVFNDGKYHSVDTKLAWGYRLNIGYVFPCTSNDVVLAYSHVDHDDSDFIERGPGAILPTFTSDTIGGTIIIPAQPGVIDFEFSGSPFVDASLYAIFAAYDGVGIGGVPIDTAKGKADFKYTAWDLEFGQYVSLGCNTRIRLFAGIRGAHIEHRYDVFYSGTSFTDVSDFLELEIDDVGLLTLHGLIVNHQKSDYSGAGPRLGLNVSYTLTGGISVTAETSSAILVGETDADFRKDFFATATLTEILPINSTNIESVTTTFSDSQNFKHPHQTRVSPNLETKLGFSYTYQFPKPYKSQLTVDAGYMSTHYFNTTDRLTSVTDVAPDFRSRKTMDTTLEGPYIGLQFVL